jgi:hypothetical protein
MFVGRKTIESFGRKEGERLRRGRVSLNLMNKLIVIRMRIGEPMV